MRLPKEIKIGSRVYGVRLFDKSLDYPSGQVHSSEGAYIKLNKNLQGDELVNSLFYEITHALLHESEFEYYDGTDEEPVLLMGKLLADMLKENDLSFMRDKSANLKSN